MIIVLLVTMLIGATTCSNKDKQASKNQKEEVNVAMASTNQNCSNKEIC